MGHYTEINCWGQCDAQLPQSKVLRKLIDDPDSLTSEEIALLGDAYRSRTLRIARSGSSYFAGITSWKVTEAFGDIRFVFLSSMKNYDGEIEAFLSWLRTFCDDFVAFVREEGCPPIVHGPQGSCGLENFPITGIPEI